MKDEKENEITDGKNNVNENKSTIAENILALKDFFSSEEMKIFVNGIIETYKKSSRSNILMNISFMVAAFACIGVLAYCELVPEGTTGVLAGIIIGYFFKKND